MKISILCVAVLILSLEIRAEAEIRALAKPLPGHPGNIFVAGEQVVIPVLPSNDPSAKWQLSDYQGRTVAQNDGATNSIALGQLAPGYYELRQIGKERSVSLAVLPPLLAPTPLTSPIGVDVGMAWLHAETQQDSVANLCALAGINWVRDRVSWREMEVAKGQFAQKTRYDDTARKQAEAGLQVLQVHHDSPPWAAKNPARFPEDLRDAYSFMRALSSRWRQQVQAFEPWNEADTPRFGGHSGSEIAALQKAAYLGLKAGNPDVIACENVFASPRPHVLADFDANEPWPYFDTLNFHHYCAMEEYPALYASFRRVAGGKPLWSTEFNIPLEWSGDSAQQEPADTALRIQAERVAQMFASVLHEGSAAAFYFCLGHYSEGQIQYGILRRDLTPRPAYLALAAVGRLLADAKPLGRLPLGGDVRAFAFRARPDGIEREVIVAWSLRGDGGLKLPTRPITVFDHLGRLQPDKGPTLKLSHGALFVVCEKGVSANFPLRPPPANAPIKSRQQPSPIVLQPVIPEREVAAELSAWSCSSTQTQSVFLFAYNFAAEAANGKLSVAAPDGWNVRVPRELALAPGERKQITLTVDCSRGRTTPADTISIRGDFGPAGFPVMSLRLAPQPFTALQGAASSLADANDSKHWQPAGPAQTRASISQANGGGIAVTAQFSDGERWIFPTLSVEGSNAPPPSCFALAATITATDGQGQFRVILEQENKSAYFADFYPQPRAGQTVDALALFSAATFGEGWSAPDDGGGLKADKIRKIRVGCNPEGSKITYQIKNLRWLKSAR